MRDVSCRLPAMLIATIAVSVTALCARAENITTMLPNGQRIVIPSDGSAYSSGQGAAQPQPASSPAANAPAKAEAVQAQPAAVGNLAQPNVVQPPNLVQPPNVIQPPNGTPPAEPIGQNTPPVPAANVLPDQPDGRSPAAAAPDNAMIQSGPAPVAGAPVVSSDGPTAASTGNPTLNPLSALAKTSFVAFIEKPLFDPTRRLPPPVAPVQEVAHVVVAPPPPPETPPTLHLLGVIQGERNIAVVHRGDDTKTEMLSSGDQIDGWEVIVPPTLGLQLKKGDRVVDFTMFNVSPAGAPGTNVAQVDPEAMAMQAQQSHQRQLHPEHGRPPRNNFR